MPNPKYSPVLLPDSPYSFRITHEDQLKIIDVYRELKSASKTAEMVFYDASTVLRVVKLNGVETTPCGGVPTYPHVKNRRSKHKTSVPPEIQKKMIQEYEKNGSFSSVSKKYGFGNTTVRRVMKMNKVPSHNGGGRTGVHKSFALYRELSEEACDLYMDCYSSTEIGEMLGVDRFTVNRAIRYGGMQLRTLHQTNTIAKLRGPNCRRVLDLLEDSKKSMTTHEISCKLGSKNSKSVCLDHIGTLRHHGLVCKDGKKGHATLWKRTNKTLREAIAEVAPSPHLIDRRIPDLPSAPIARFIDDIIARERRKIAFAGDGDGTQVNGQSPVTTVCTLLGIDDRTLRRWRRGAAVSAQWNQVDKMLTKSPYNWQDIYCEKTVRKPDATIEIKLWWPMVRDGVRLLDDEGNPRWSREILRTVFIGDLGPDMDQLARINSLMGEGEDPLLAA